MQEIITIYDFLLLPVYLFIFYLIVRKKSKKYEKTGLKKIFITAFGVRMAGSILYSLLIQYYYGYGDSFGFYLGGNVLFHMINQDISSAKYFFASAQDIITAAKAMGLGDEIPVSMPQESNAFIMKISALLSFFTFDKYMLISICFGFFSFIGIWKLFYFFYQINNKKNVKLLSVFILFFPSLWFWGSGLLKEPVCVGSLGILVYLFYNNFIEKRYSIRDILLMACLLFILTMVKSYITVILIISFSAVLIFKIITKIKNIAFRIIFNVFILIIIICTLVLIDFRSYTQDYLDSSFVQIQQFQKSYKDIQDMDETRSKSTFAIEGINTSSESMLANGPVVIATCLFRPFIWEAKKIIIFFASLEAFFTLIITAYLLLKTKIYRFFKYIFASPQLLFCFIFSISFALVIGYTTFNFGTMIRYKIIFLPFYFFLLISIYQKYQQHQLE